MGRCPYCMTPKLPEDVICFSCGRMTGGTAGTKSRTTGRFKSTPTRGAKRGKAPKMAVSSQRRRGKKGNMRNLALVGAVAFIFLFTPAQEGLLDIWTDLSDDLMELMQPGREYPLEASFTVARTSTYENDGTGNVDIMQRYPVPPQRTSKGIAATHYSVAAGSDEGPFPATMLQEITGLRLITSSQTIQIPFDGTTRSKGNAVSLSDGTLVYWPAAGAGGERCSFGQCIIWESTLLPGETEVVSLEADVVSKSWSWWQHSRVDSNIEGKSWGVNAERSGNFEDIQEREGGAYWYQFGRHKQWVWSNEWSEYVIDGTADNIVQAAIDINASLPSGMHDNVYAFARATFDYLHDKLVYDPNAPVHARSGSACLAAGLGDCDEQSNAWMSILRVRQVPTWYEFGALLDTTQDKWQAHGWANIMIPLSDNYCDSAGISLNSCYVEASVDVVNNKWLLNTPTIYTDWIEVADPDGDFVTDYYSPTTYWVQTGGHLNRAMTIETSAGPVFTGSTYMVKQMPESF